MWHHFTFLSCFIDRLRGRPGAHGAHHGLVVHDKSGDVLGGRRKQRPHHRGHHSTPRRWHLRRLKRLLGLTPAPSPSSEEPPDVSPPALVPHAPPPPRQPPLPPAHAPAPAPRSSPERIRNGDERRFLIWIPQQWRRRGWKWRPAWPSRRPAWKDWPSHLAQLGLEQRL